jgi:alkane 1-monooxygenase
MMRPWRSIKYLAVYITPAVVFFSLYSKDGWSYFALAFVFLIVPFTELFTKGSSLNLSEAEEEVAKKDRLYDWLLYGLVPVQYALMVYFLWQIQSTGCIGSCKIWYDDRFRYGLWRTRHKCGP